MRPIGEALVRCKVNLSTVALGTMPMKITVALVEVDQRTRRPTVPRDTPFKTRGRMSSGGGAHTVQGSSHYGQQDAFDRSSTASDPDWNGLHAGPSTRLKLSGPTPAPTPPFVNKVGD